MEWAQNATVRSLTAAQEIVKHDVARELPYFESGKMLGSVGSKRACLLMREIVTLRRLFFSLF